MSVKIIIIDGIAKDYVKCDHCETLVYNTTLFNAASFIPTGWTIFDEKVKGFLTRKHLCKKCTK